MSCFRLLGLIVSFAFVVCAQAQTAPTIASITSSRTVTEGASVTFSVSVNGTTPFTYKWAKDGVEIAGATANLYTLAAVKVKDEGNYTVVVTNTVGSVTGGPIALAVQPATPPTFSYGPSARTLTVGQTLSLSAGVNGTGPFTFTWRRGDTVVATETSDYSSNFSKAGVTTADAGIYTVTAVNAVGSATSGAATVTVTAAVAPTITSQPENTTVDLGGWAYLRVSVSGSFPMTFQWFKDDQAIQGATGSTYEVYAGTASAAGKYKVTISNSAGSVTSESASVTLRAALPPTIQDVSAGTTVQAGEGFYFSVSVTGTAPFTYQWKKDGQVIVGATGSYYSRSAASAADAGSYTVTVTNAVGTATSAGMPLTVSAAQAPLITAHPAGVAVNPGESLSLYVNASGTGSLTYAWRKDGVVIAGSNSSYYSRYDASASDSGTYSVVVSNSFGSVTSLAALVTVRPASAPVITTHPAGADLFVGNQVQFYVRAVGFPSPSFQWYKDGVAIAGATQDYYWKSNLASSDEGAYTVLVKNSAGEVTSGAATLKVRSPLKPTVVSHPVSFSILPGGYGGQLSASADGASISAQWYKDGVAFGDPTSGSYASLSIYSAQPSNAGTYKVVFTNSAGSVTTKEGTVTVDTVAARPLITFTQGSYAFIPQSYSYLYVRIETRSSNAKVQWYKDGVLISGATSSAYEKYPATRADAGTYTAKVTLGSASATSGDIVVSVYGDDVLPRFAAQPASASGLQGGSAYFNGVVVGTNPLSYQWYKDGVAVSGATGDYLSLRNLAAADAGTYTLKATNALGSATSVGAVLTLGTATTPYIRRQPASQTVTAGSGYGSLGVELGNFEAYAASFQWKKDGVAIPNANSSYYYLSSPITASSAGTYSVVVVAGGVTLTSNDAIITVSQRKTGPSFTAQPTNVSVVEGATATFTATVSSTATITYQWRKDGTNLAGATSASLTIPIVRAADAGIYTLLATDVDGAASSIGASLTVTSGTPPVISGQPAGRTAQQGETVSFTAAATGNPAPTWQWRKDGAAISGATSNTLTLTNVQSGDSGNYNVVATNVAGSATSSSATLLVFTQPTSAPGFTLQPTDQFAPNGSTATFSAAASGYPAPTYQWFRNNVALPGATAATLTLASVQATDEGTYQVTATNLFGTATSASATLSRGSPFAGSYRGSMANGDTWLMHVRADGSAMLLVHLASANRALVASAFSVGADGSFSFGDAQADLAASAASSPFLLKGRVSGQIQNRRLTGTLPGGIAFAGDWLSGTQTAAVAGYYEAAPLSSDSGSVHLLTTTDGVVLLVALTPDGVRGAMGTLGGDGQFQADGTGYSYNGRVAPASGNVDAVFQPAGGAAVIVATPANTQSAERLTGLSTRGLAGAGTKTMIAGFVVRGSAPKTVIIRAIGPTLSALNVTGGLRDPRLRLFKDATPILENDNWATGDSAGAVTAAMRTAGLFALPAGSADAVLVAELQPGNYSAHVTADDSTSGVSLVEVYDLTAAQAGAPRMIGLSTRGEIGQGDNVMIVGVAVTGDRPKKLLIRAVGPTLAALGLTGTIADPRLQLFSGSTPVRANDDWSSGSEATAIAAAALSAGTFALPTGSKDAALLLHLAPGNYTAVASGAAGATGVALVEIYEVP